MELRRAILLFAIVLGVAAIATSLSRPPQSTESRRERGAPSQPTANPGPGGAPATKPSAPIVFRAARSGAGPETESLKAGRAATVRVETRVPGEVSVEGLGLLTYAERRVPGRLEVLTTVPDRYEVRFTPTVGGESRTVGFLQVTP